MSLPTDDIETYAWCFDHGTLHTFLRKEGPSCNAAWVAISAPSKDAAVKQKELVWGEAQFFHQLPLLLQGGVIAMMDSRKNRYVRDSDSAE